MVERLESRRLLSVSLSGATNLGAFNGRSTFNDSLSSSNMSDVRKLTLAVAATLKASLSGLSANADLQLIKDANSNLIVDSGEVLANSAHTGAAAESLSKSLAAGTYYVRVFEPASASTKYSLVLQSDAAGNTLGAARNVGALSAAVSFKDFVGSTDTDDFYKFSLASTKPFTASLSGLSADANLQLIRDKNSNGVIDSGDVLTTSAHTGTTTEIISKPLVAGTYFIRVYRGSGDTNYSLSLTPVGHLTIQFNYSLDASGFFAAHPAAKDRLNDAAAAFAIFTDNLSAIAPSGSNTWSEVFFNPGVAGGPQATIANQKIAANTVVVYIGARNDLSGLELGEGGPGGFSAGGTQAWLNTVSGRGQSGALLANPTDAGPWGGAISFSSTANWNFSASSPTSGQNDFFSVALHELGHVFGIGTAGSWDDKVSGNTFTGASSRAANGGVNPQLDSANAHWKQGTKSTVNGVTQDVVMEPALLTGTRRQFTKLDYAGLADVGWQIPSSAATVTAAVSAAQPLAALPAATLNDSAKPLSVANEIFGRIEGVSELFL
jgi:hypothetical protein